MRLLPVTDKVRREGGREGGREGREGGEGEEILEDSFFSFAGLKYIYDFEAFDHSFALPPSFLPSGIRARPSHQETS